jgi:hypothetical protein
MDRISGVAHINRQGLAMTAVQRRGIAPSGPRSIGGQRGGCVYGAGVRAPLA